MDSHWKRVLVLHGDGEEGIVVVLHLPEVSFFVMGKNPSSGPSIFSLAVHTLIKDLIT